MVGLARRDFVVGAGCSVVCFLGLGGSAVAKMIDPKTISEELMYTTARIVGEGHSNGTSLGTGFFYRVSVSEDKAAILLVTNKHVIENTKITSFQVHTRSGEGSPPDGNITLHSDTGQMDTSSRRQS
jgi:hypothetical protein